MSDEFNEEFKDANEEIEIISADFGHVYCGNCRKTKHCIAGFKKGEAPEMVKDRCNNPNCECKCRRYYLAKNGKLRKYGLMDDTDPLEGFNMSEERTEIDDIIDMANATVRREPKFEVTHDL